VHFCDNGWGKRIEAKQMGMQKHVTTIHFLDVRPERKLWRKGIRRIGLLFHVKKGWREGKKEKKEGEWWRSGTRRTVGREGTREIWAIIELKEKREEFVRQFWSQRVGKNKTREKKKMAKGHQI